jgi:hypothetical protein
LSGRAVHLSTAAQTIIIRQSRWRSQAGGGQCEAKPSAALVSS